MKNDPPVHDANVFGAGHDDKDGDKHDLENKVSRYLNRRSVQAIHVDYCGDADRLVAGDSEATEPS
jgi:hypothetical protein